MAEFRGAGEAGEAENAPILFAHSVGAINEVAVTPLRNLRKINTLPIDKTALPVQLIDGDGDFAAWSTTGNNVPRTLATPSIQGCAPGTVVSAGNGRISITSSKPDASRCEPIR